MFLRSFWSPLFGAVNPPARGTVLTAGISQIVTFPTAELKGTRREVKLREHPPSRVKRAGNPIALPSEIGLSGDKSRFGGNVPRGSRLRDDVF